MAGPVEKSQLYASIEFMRRAGIATFIGCELASFTNKGDAIPSLVQPDGKTAMQPKAVWITGGGTIVVDLADGSLQGEPFVVQANSIFYFAVSRIAFQGTTATGLKFLY